LCCHLVGGCANPAESLEVTPVTPALAPGVTSFWSVHH
jgi:hypothetical protein